MLSGQQENMQLLLELYVILYQVINQLFLTFGTWKDKSLLSILQFFLNLLRLASYTNRTRKYPALTTDNQV